MPLARPGRSVACELGFRGADACNESLPTSGINAARSSLQGDKCNEDGAKAIKNAGMLQQLYERMVMDCSITAEAGARPPLWPTTPAYGSHRRRGMSRSVESSGAGKKKFGDFDSSSSRFCSVLFDEQN